jgi:hypothetical protein
VDILSEKIAGKLIKENRDVILYGAGIDAMSVITELRDRYSVHPSCICDGDKGKWHKSLLGVEIVSIDEALTAYPDAMIFISSGSYKYQIIGQLLTSGKVSKERILNYEPVEKRKSCIYLESYIVSIKHRLYFCCSDFGKNQSPSVAFNGDYNIAAREFITYRDKLISDLNHGVPTPCDGCPYIKEDWYSRKRRIALLNDGEPGICNFNCCYCESSAKTSKDASNDISMQKLLEIFHARSLLAHEPHTIVSCGEICLHPRRSEIYDSISEFQNMVCTNASVYDQKLAQLLELGHTEINCSVDAGTRSTFRKVKGCDLFDKVCENLRRYGSAGRVILKYILLPGINDNEADINGFVSLCKDVKTDYVQVSYDLNAPPELTAQAAVASKYLVDKLYENGIIYRVISDVIAASVTAREKQ